MDYKTKQTIGAEKKDQLNYNEVSKSRKQLSLVPIPEKVLTQAEATAGIQVGKGKLCRVFGTAADFVVFGSEIPGVPSATTQTAAQLGATVIMIVATDEFIRCSAGVTRVEVIAD